MQIVQIDEILLPFVQASGEAEREKILSQLIAEYAEPIIVKILNYKTRHATDYKAQTDAEEIHGEVILQLVRRLQNFQDDYKERPINDFRSYVAVTTYNAYDRYVSRKYPNRRRLKNGLRYLLSHRAEFAVWQKSDGSWVGGLSRWQNEISDNSLEAPAQNRLLELRDNPRAFAREADSNWHQQKYGYELLSAIFAWTRAPVELDLLTGVVADWWNVTDETVEIDARSYAAANDTRENTSMQIADTRAPVSIETERRVYLQKLWSEILELPTRQRAALLLNLRDDAGRGIVNLWIIVGVATTQNIAAALELTPEKFAELWRELPLDDNRIAALLEITRQQVINLRKSARERLARRMKAF